MIDRNFVINMAQESSDINEYLMSLYNVPVQMNAKTIVEIGAGRSTFALVAAANKIGGHVYSIDIGGWDTLNRQVNGVEIMQQEPNFTMIANNSLNEADNWHTDIDFLFWDSEHTYDLSVREIDAWFPFVKSGGIIMAHDMCHESEDKQGARKALDKFLRTQAGKDYKAIFLNDTKIIGMGVIWKMIYE